LQSEKNDSEHLVRSFFRHLLTVKVQARFQASPCEIYGGEVAPVQTSSEYLNFPVSLIPPIVLSSYIFHSYSHYLKY